MSRRTTRLGKRPRNGSSSAVDVARSIEALQQLATHTLPILSDQVHKAVQASSSLVLLHDKADPVLHRWTSSLKQQVLHVAAEARTHARNIQLSQQKQQKLTHTQVTPFGAAMDQQPAAATEQNAVIRVIRPLLTRIDRDTTRLAHRLQRIAKDEHMDKRGQDKDNNNKLQAQQQQQQQPKTELKTKNYLTEQQNRENRSPLQQQQQQWRQQGGAGDSGLTRKRVKGAIAWGTGPTPKPHHAPTATSSLTVHSSTVAPLHGKKHPSDALLSPSAADQRVRIAWARREALQSPDNATSARERAWQRIQQKEEQLVSAPPVAAEQQQATAQLKRAQQIQVQKERERRQALQVKQDKIEQLQTQKEQREQLISQKRIESARLKLKEQQRREKWSHRRSVSTSSMDTAAEEDGMAVSDTISTSSASSSSLSRSNAWDRTLKDEESEQLRRAKLMQRHKQALLEQKIQQREQRILQLREQRSPATDDGIAFSFARSAKAVAEEGSRTDRGWNSSRRRRVASGSHTPRSATDSEPDIDRSYKYLEQNRNNRGVDFSRAPDRGLIAGDKKRKRVETADERPPAVHVLQLPADPTAALRKKPLGGGFGRAEMNEHVRSSLDGNRGQQTSTPSLATHLNFAAIETKPPSYAFARGESITGLRHAFSDDSDPLLLDGIEGDIVPIARDKDAATRPVKNSSKFGPGLDVSLQQKREREQQRQEHQHDTESTGRNAGPSGPVTVHNSMASRISGIPIMKAAPVPPPDVAFDDDEQGGLFSVIDTDTAVRAQAPHISGPIFAKQQGRVPAGHRTKGGENLDTRVIVSVAVRGPPAAPGYVDMARQMKPRFGGTMDDSDDEGFREGRIVAIGNPQSVPKRVKGAVAYMKTKVGKEHGDMPADDRPALEPQLGSIEPQVAGARISQAGIIADDANDDVLNEERIANAGVLDLNPDDEFTRKNTVAANFGSLAGRQSLFHDDSSLRIVHNTENARAAQDGHVMAVDFANSKGRDDKPSPRRANEDCLHPVTSEIDKHVPAATLHVRGRHDQGAGSRDLEDETCLHPSDKLFRKRDPAVAFPTSAIGIAHGASPDGDVMRANEECLHPNRGFGKKGVPAIAFGTEPLPGSALLERNGEDCLHPDPSSVVPLTPGGALDRAQRFLSDLKDGDKDDRDYDAAKDGLVHSKAPSQPFGTAYMLTPDYNGRLRGIADILLRAKTFLDTDAQLRERANGYGLEAPGEHRDTAIDDRLPLHVSRAIEASKPILPGPGAYSPKLEFTKPRTQAAVISHAGQSKSLGSAGGAKAKEEATKAKTKYPSASRPSPRKFISSVGAGPSATFGTAPRLAFVDEVVRDVTAGPGTSAVNEEKGTERARANIPGPVFLSAPRFEDDRQYVPPGTVAVEGSAAEAASKLLRKRAPSAVFGTEARKHVLDDNGTQPSETNKSRMLISKDGKQPIKPVPGPVFGTAPRFSKPIKKENEPSATKHGTIPPILPASPGRLLRKSVPGPVFGRAPEHGPSKQSSLDGGPGPATYAAPLDRSSTVTGGNKKQGPHFGTAKRFDVKKEARTLSTVAASDGAEPVSVSVVAAPVKGVVFGTATRFTTDKKGGEVTGNKVAARRSSAPKPWSSSLRGSRHATNRKTSVFDRSLRFLASQCTNHPSGGVCNACAPMRSRFRALQADADVQAARIADAEHKAWVREEEGLRRKLAAMGTAHVPEIETVRSAREPPMRVDIRERPVLQRESVGEQ